MHVGPGVPGDCLLPQADCILSASLSPRTPTHVCSPPPMCMHGAELRQLGGPSLAPEQSCGSYLRSGTGANAIFGWGALLAPACRSYCLSAGTKPSSEQGGTTGPGCSHPCPVRQGRDETPLSHGACLNSNEAFAGKWTQASKQHTWATDGIGSCPRHWFLSPAYSDSTMALLF